jgi:hypothetical protein
LRSRGEASDLRRQDVSGAEASRRLSWSRVRG